MYVDIASNKIAELLT